MKFGIFEHMDDSGVPLGRQFESRLSLLEACDRYGFYAYHLAEHHGTPLGLAPSPGLFLAAVAQRTKRLRFGPLSYSLPLYHPIRLIEEICMLDQMSGGRFELGVGRGISPYELAHAGVNFLESAEMYEEALEVILAGLAGGPLTHRGRHCRYTNRPIELEPLQRPHPPLWQGVGSPQAAAGAARRGANIVGTAPNATLKTLVDAYASSRADRSGGSPPLLGAQRHVYVADTDAQARDEARGPYKVWYDSISYLWRKFGSAPIRFADSLDRALAIDAAIVGSPT